MREVTRRRGVGLYLVQDAQRQLPQVAHWQLSTAGLAPRERGEVDNFHARLRLRTAGRSLAK